MAAASHSSRPPLSPSCWGRGWRKADLGNGILCPLWSAPHTDARDHLPSPWLAHLLASLDCCRSHRAHMVFSSQQSSERVPPSHFTASGGGASTLFTQGLTPRPGTMGPELHSLSACRGVVTFPCCSFTHVPDREAEGQRRAVSHSRSCEEALRTPVSFCPFSLPTLIIHPTPHPSRAGGPSA